MSTTTQTEELLDGKPVHPLASLFPPMSEEEFAAISQDVQANGLVEPIVLLDGQILGGTHRLKACLKVGIPPRYQTWKGEGGTPMQYVWARNWTRRHLTAGQRAVVSLAAERELASEAATRMSPRGRAAKRGMERIPYLSPTGKARDMAAEIHIMRDCYGVATSRRWRPSRIVFRMTGIFSRLSSQCRALTLSNAGSVRLHRRES